MSILRLLKYPNKSHRKTIKIPEESADLAELIGAIAGDGGVSNWQVIISLNSITDLRYAHFIMNLFEKLFGIKPTARKRIGQNCIVVDCSSRNITDFLIEKGVVKGHKIKHRLNIPSWILLKADYKVAFLRGLFDTDGCTFIDHHQNKAKIYGNIGLAFTNYSLPLLESINQILRELGYSPTITTRFRVLLRRESEVFRFFREFSPNNERHYDKLREFLEEYRSGCNGTVSKAVVG